MEQCKLKGSATGLARIVIVMSVQHPIALCNPACIVHDKYKRRDRNRWLYCLHKEWEDHNDAVRRAFEDVQHVVNKRFLCEDDGQADYTVVWSSSDPQLAAEFKVDLSRSNVMFIATCDGKELGRCDCLETHAFEHWLTQMYRRRQPRHEVRHEVRHEPSQQKQLVIKKEPYELPQQDYEPPSKPIPSTPSLSQRFKSFFSFS